MSQTVSGATTPVPASKPKSVGRGLCALGWGLFFLGVGIYAVQFFLLKQYVVPWYMPILGTLGILLMLRAMSRRWSVLRIVGLLGLGFLTALQWAMLLWLLRTPAYAGPDVGKPIPIFAALRADGSPFTDRELTGQPTVLLFFRGHW